MYDKSFLNVIYANEKFTEYSCILDFHEIEFN